MGEKEVERILGRAPGDYRTRGVLYYFVVSGSLSHPRGRAHEWLADNVRITIWFLEGKVAYIQKWTAITEHQPPRDSWRTFFRESWLGIKDCFVQMVTAYEKLYAIVGW
jgi:hypothetical protein